MKKFKQQIFSRSILGLVVMVMGLGNPLQAASYTLRWYLGHQNLDYFEEAAFKFKKDVEKGSNGDIAIEIVLQAVDARSTDSDQSLAIADKVARGEVEMGHSFTDIMGSVDPKFYAFDAPYLFRGYRHLEGVFEGPLGKEMLEGLRAHGLRGLSFTYSGGANGIATRDKEIRSLEDFKGLKIGALDNKVNRAWLESLGATLVPIEHEREEDVIAPERDLGVNGIIITWRNLDQAGNNSGFRRMNLMNISYLVSMTYINEKYFNSLPKKYQTLITKASQEAGVIERAKTIQLNQWAKMVLESKGVRSVYISRENRRLLEKRLRPAYQQSIHAILGKNLVHKIKNTKNAPEHPSVLGIVKR